MPVLDTVTHRAAQLCDSKDARLFLLEGDTLRSVTGFGEFTGTFPTWPLTRGLPIGRAIIDQTVVHIEDIASELKKVTWPTRDETVYLTTVVIVVAVSVGILLGGIDLFFNWFMDRLLLR